MANDELDIFDEEVVTIRLNAMLLSKVDDFAWFRYTDRTEAIHFLLRQGLAKQDQIKTPYGDRRQEPDEVIVDVRDDCVSIDPWV